MTHDAELRVDGMTLRLTRDDGPITADDLDNLRDVVMASRKLWSEVRNSVQTEAASRIMDRLPLLNDPDREANQ